MTITSILNLKISIPPTSEPQKGAAVQSNTFSNTLQAAETSQSATGNSNDAINPKSQASTSEAALFIPIKSAKIAVDAVPFTIPPPSAAMVTPLKEPPPPLPAGKGGSKEDHGTEPNAQPTQPDLATALQASGMHGAFLTTSAQSLAIAFGSIKTSVPLLGALPIDSTPVTFSKGSANSRALVSVATPQIQPASNSPGKQATSPVESAASLLPNTSSGPDQAVDSQLKSTSTIPLLPPADLTFEAPVRISVATTPELSQKPLSATPHNALASPQLPPNTNNTPITTTATPMQAQIPSASSLPQQQAAAQSATELSPSVVTNSSKSSEQPLPRVKEPTYQASISSGSKIIGKGSTSLRGQSNAGSDPSPGDGSTSNNGNNSPTRDPGLAQTPAEISLENQTGSGAIPQTTVITASARTTSPLSPIQTDRITTQVADRITLMAARRQDSTVTIHLSPTNLGEITVTVRSVGKSIDAMLSASNDHVRNALNANREDLTQTLQARGVAVAAVSVSHHSSDAGPNRNPSQNQADFGNKPGTGSGEKNQSQQDSTRQSNVMTHLSEPLIGAISQDLTLDPSKGLNLTI